LRLLPLSIIHQKAQEPSIVQGRTPGVGLEEWGAATKYLGEVLLMGIKRFDHKTKVKARSERQNLQAALQLCANK